MFIFQLHHKSIILCLLFMGIQRAVGDPVAVTADLLETTTTEEPKKKHHLPQTIDDNEEAMNHHLECNRKSGEILEKLKITTELIDSIRDGFDRELEKTTSKNEFLDFLEDGDKNKSLFKKLCMKNLLEGAIEYDDPLKKMALIEKYVNSLVRTIMDWFHGKVKSDDLDLTLSNEAKVYLVCLLRFLDRTYNDRINDYVIHQTKVNEEMSELVSLKNSLEQLSGNLTDTKNYMEFFKKMHSFLVDYDLFKSQTVRSNRLNERWMRYFMSSTFQEVLLLFVDNKTMIFEPSSWIQSGKQWIDLIDKVMEIYRQLNQYSGDVSDLFESRPTKSSLADWYNGLDEKNKSKVNQLIIGKQKYNVTCDDGRLVVRGFWIQLSDLYGMRYHKQCRQLNYLKEVALLAVDTVYIDTSTLTYFLEDVNLFIAAPKWEVFGAKTISLSGNDAGNMFENSNEDDGSNGRPGLPGPNGRHFFGIGLNFSNADQLVVISDGGDGGRGEDGAKGPAGRDGVDAYTKFQLGKYRDEFHSFPPTKGSEVFYLPDNLPADESNSIHGVGPFDIMDGFQCSASCENNRPGFQLYKADGECGSFGGPGGLGGEGGMGGYPGTLQIVELGQPSHINLTAVSGNRGERGEVGEPGDRGRDGRAMICSKVEKKEEESSRDKSYWKCQPTNIFPPKCDQHPPQQLNNETEQYSTTGMQQPAPISSPDFSDYLQKYAVLLKTYSNHPLFKKTIADFNEAIQRKFSTNLEEMGQLFF